MNNRQPNQSLVDQKIHFIWLGRIMPEKNKDVVKQWRNINPDYRITVWLDEKTVSEEELRDFIKEMITCDIKVKDITRENVIHDCIRHELDKEVPNYGMASDMLRLSILTMKGGIYLDSDVLPVDPLPQTIYAPNGILFSPWSQGKKVISNDILMCPKKSELMLRLSKETEVSYVNRGYIYKYSTSAEGPDFSNEAADYMKMVTLIITGPTFVASWINQLHISVNPYAFICTGGESCHIKPDYLFTGSAQKPPYFKVRDEKNDVCDLSWLNNKLRPGIVSMTYRERLNNAINLITFEIENKGWLCITDYVKQLSKLDHENKSMEEIADDILIELLKNTALLIKIKDVQIIPHISSFYGQQLMKQLQLIKLASKCCDAHLVKLMESMDKEQIYQNEIEVYLNAIISLWGDGSQYQGCEYRLVAFINLLWKIFEKMPNIKYKFDLIQEQSLSILEAKNKEDILASPTSIFSRDFTTEMRRDKLAACLDMLQNKVSKIRKKKHISFLTHKQDEKNSPVSWPATTVKYGALVTAFGLYARYAVLRPVNSINSPRLKSF